MCMYTLCAWPIGWVRCTFLRAGETGYFKAKINSCLLVCSLEFVYGGSIMSF